MAKSESERKTRSDRFPLTLHRTGQFCKKIKGKLYYFGTDKQRASRRYLEQAACLRAHNDLKLTDIAPPAQMKLRHSNKTMIYYGRLQSPRPVLSAEKVLNVPQHASGPFGACRLGLRLFARPRDEPSFVRVPLSCCGPDRVILGDARRPGL